MNWILVGFSAWGRCGTSAVMGLLARAGANVGPVGSNADVWNPGGYYEVQSRVDYERAIFGRHVDLLCEPWSPEEVQAICDANRGEYGGLLDRLYGQAGTAALKSQHYVTLPMFDHKSRVIAMHRNPDDWARSLTAVRYGGDGVDSELLCWVKKMEYWASEMLKRSEKPVLHVQYERLLDNPVDEGQRILRWCGLHVLDPSDISGWIHPEWSRFRR